jgi:propanol-preferring alcohol dehydrogenase
LYRLLGHECAGVIVSVGELVPQSRVGERVVLYYYAGCRKCSHCLIGNEQLCGSCTAQYGFTSDGALAQYLTVYSRNAVLLPDTIPFKDAAPIGCGVTTAVHAFKLADIKKGEWIAILGVNGVGFHLIQLAKHLGAKVIAICRSDAKRQKAMQLGADAVVDGTEISTISASVRAITCDMGADVIFECVGSGETISQCLGWTGALGKRGRLIFIGYQNDDENSVHVHPLSLIVYEQKIQGSVGCSLEDLKEAIKYVETGVITPVIDSCIPLSDFQSGLDSMKNCKCIGKIVITDFDN